ncbi:hypothetical protein PUNSTDRAFT_25536, partial [Punctularia strigosozonata HHB-11173 SS5]|uniref:uncharacterized protein n=1 Tax=Punctularia strigosozonata (strain HHB-11173) TaxID=741275 RepID=UPI00044183A6
LPPGPKRWMPWIGNAFSIPVDHPWLVYEKWHKTYGDMIYVKAFGAGILILGSLEDCSELLEKRSSNYSDRPRFPMV